MTFFTQLAKPTLRKIRAGGIKILHSRVYNNEIVAKAAGTVIGQTNRIIKWIRGSRNIYKQLQS